MHYLLILATRPVDRSNWISKACSITAESQKVKLQAEITNFGDLAAESYDLKHQDQDRDLEDHFPY